MKYALATILSLLITIGSAQDFYDINTVQTIEITFDQPNWDALMDAQKAGDEDYIMASSVSINGIAYDSIGVKYKGNSTYSANRTKNGLHIEMDTYKDHDHQGYTDIKLSNGYKDPSFVREVLSYDIIRQYMDAPLSNYADVYINGDLIGLYSNSEAISKKFVNNRFGSKRNTFIKCNPIDGAGPQSNDLPDLVYMGQDSTDYYAAYELKSDHGWQDLIDFCDTLTNHTDAIEQVLDVDRALWMLALDNTLVNLDSYIGRFTQNYYLYQNDYGQMMPVIWDLNESLGVFSSTGSSNLNSTTQKQQMSHLLHANDSGFPLVQKLLSIPTYRKMYLAHIKTILTENFQNGHYATTAQLLQDVATESVQNDPNAFFTYNQFITNLNNDINSGGGPGGIRAPGITTLMDGRSSYLLGLPDFTATQPVISDVVAADTPILFDDVTIRATVVDADEVSMGYRYDQQAPFVSVPMFDDGAHDDGAAGDGIYGAALPLASASIQYYIYGQNETIGAFSPARAAYEYYTLTASSQAGDLVINEVLASNDSIASDQDQEFDDWIELYNNTDQAIDLSGYLLSDNSESLGKWAFPEGTTIGGSDYLIIWADSDEDQEGLHASFKLSAGGEAVFLSDPDSMIVDQVSFEDQTTDISYGRFPNGTGGFQTMTPTFNTQNTVTTNTDDPAYHQLTVSLFPNPVSDLLSVNVETGIRKVLVYTIDGMLLQDHQFQGQQSVNIDVSSVQKGIYLLKIYDTQASFTTKQVAIYK